MTILIVYAPENRLQITWRKKTDRTKGRKQQITTTREFSTPFSVIDKQIDKTRIHKDWSDTPDLLNLTDIFNTLSQNCVRHTFFLVHMEHLA
jgi:hypothetical protein